MLARLNCSWKQGPFVARREQNGFKKYYDEHPLPAKQSSAYTPAKIVEPNSESLIFFRTNQNRGTYNTHCQTLKFKITDFIRHFERENDWQNRSEKSTWKRAVVGTSNSTHRNLSSRSAQTENPKL